MRPPRLVKWLLILFVGVMSARQTASIKAYFRDPFILPGMKLHVPDGWDRFADADSEWRDVDAMILKSGASGEPDNAIFVDVFQDEGSLITWHRKTLALQGQSACQAVIEDIEGVKCTVYKVTPKESNNPFATRIILAAHHENLWYYVHVIAEHTTPDAQVYDDLRAAIEWTPLSSEGDQPDLRRGV